MSRRKVSTDILTANAVNGLCVLGVLVGPAELAWQFTMCGIGTVSLCFVVRRYIKGDPPSPEQKARQRYWDRTNRIRALENELGFEPMELWSDEDPDIVARPAEKERD